MNIHTILYNNDPIDFLNEKINSNDKLNIWNNKQIVDLINLKYPEYNIFYKKLILNKSRENFSKYIIIKEFGGIFININIIKTLSLKNNMTINKLSKSKYEMIFWLEKEQNEFTIDIFNINENILNDDIFYIKNKSNSFIEWLIKKIDITKIPINEYENKLNLGNIFLSNNLFDFYLMNFNIRAGIKNYWFKNLPDKLKSNSKLKFEKSIYLIKIKNKLPINLFYQIKTYPSIPELINPENLLNPWDIYYRIINYFQNIIILISFQYRNWYFIIIIILLITSINFIVRKIIIDNININIKPAQFDSKIFLNTKKFKFFRELQKNWKDIRDEALFILSNIPKLDISKNIKDFNNNEIFYNPIKNKLGWISLLQNIDNDSKNNNLSDYNNCSLYYGLLNNKNKFIENVKFCPKTIKLLDDIKYDINFCGFNLMRGGSIILPHCNNQVLSNEKLSFHLGLSIPKPTNSCRIIIKNDNNEYFYKNEENGKIIIFDSTYEHYSYNQSNEDQLILLMDFVSL